MLLFASALVSSLLFACDTYLPYPPLSLNPPWTLQLLLRFIASKSHSFPCLFSSVRHAVLRVPSTFPNLPQRVHRTYILDTGRSPTRALLSSFPRTEPRTLFRLFSSTRQAKEPSVLTDSGREGDQRAGIDHPEVRRDRMDAWKGIKSTGEEESEGKCPSRESKEDEEGRFAILEASGCRRMCGMGSR